MAKRPLSERIEDLEEDQVNLHREIAEVERVLLKQIDELKKWMDNGFSERVANIVGVKLAEHQQAEWQRERGEREMQLKEKELRDRKYGAERDRKMKLTISLIATLGVPAAAAIGAAVSRLLGG